MPAVVSSTDGSKLAGTSEPDGNRLWSRAPKNSRKVLRISSEVTKRSLGGDGAGPDDQLAVQQDRRLAGGGAQPRVVKAQLETVVAAGRRVQSDAQRRRAVP